MTTNDQLSAFPMTKLETAELFLVHFQAGVDKAEKSLDTARANLMHACQLRDIAEGNLRRMQDDGVQSVAEIAAEIVNSGALDADGLTVTATLGTPGVDPVTGELEQVASCSDCVAVDKCNLAQPDGVVTGCGAAPLVAKADPPAVVNEWDERPCQQCGGEGRLPDRTGGGHHRCKACDGTGTVSVASASPCVVAVYPGDDDPHVTVVGDRTQYGELVADYFTAAGLNGNHDAKDWQVLAEHELTAPGGGRRKLRDVIAPADYGRRLLIAAADQASAAG